MKKRERAVAKTGGKGKREAPVVVPAAEEYADAEVVEDAPLVAVPREAPEEEGGDGDVVLADDGFEILPAAPADDLIPLEEEGFEAPEVVEPRAAPVRDVVPFDPLEAYLREIARITPLTREEEREIAVDYYERKNIESARRLISSNLWLVVKVARDYERAARNLLDLIQEGNIGLLEAVKNFDPYRDVRFPSYAVWWIKAYIIRYVIANWRLVKIGTTQAQRKLFFNLKKEKDRLEREGFYPGPKLIASSLNVKESEVVEMEQRLSGSDLSVDAPLPGDSESNLLSMLPGEGPNAEELVSLKQREEILRKSLEDFRAVLNEKERAIFEERLLSEEKATLQDLAERLDLSKERVRQIENRVKEKLKAFLVERLGSSLEGVLSF